MIAFSLPNFSYIPLFFRFASTMVALWILSAGILGCISPSAERSGEDHTSVESPVPESEINDSPRHEIILTGNHSGVSAQRFDVVGNSGSLRRIWAEIAPATRGRDSLKVDFEEQTLLALFAGVRPSGGFEVGVSKVVRVDEFAEVHVSITPPAMGRNVTQAQTTPFALVLLDYPCEKVRIIQKSE